MMRPVDTATERVTNPTVAVIDIGTVSTRLFVAKVGPTGTVDPQVRLTTITDLGEGVDASGYLLPAAIERVFSAVDAYLAEVLRMTDPVYISTTTTSAARDASNAEDLLGGLRSRGLLPVVIEGSVEARLSFTGVSSNFYGERIVVADIGGGSTELTCGSRTEQGTLAIEASHSFDVGCRRVSERFAGTGDGRLLCQDAQGARAFVSGEFEQFKGMLEGPLPERLVCVGGTTTTLVAIDQKIVPYDSTRVHLHSLSRDRVSFLSDLLRAMTVEQRRKVAGLQEKRAPVIAAGALILEELMGLRPWDMYTASEADSRHGIAVCAQAALCGGASPANWVPTLVCTK